jgi:hypothetical protein
MGGVAWGYGVLEMHACIGSPTVNVLRLVQTIRRRQERLLATSPSEELRMESSELNGGGDINRFGAG